MKFNETTLYNIISIPGEEFEKDCGYYFALKLPIIILATVIFLPVAILIDTFLAINRILDY